MMPGTAFVIFGLLDSRSSSHPLALHRIHPKILDVDLFEPINSEILVVLPSNLSADWPYTIGLGT